MVIASFRSAIAELKFTAQGEAKLVLTIPYGDRHDVQPLMDESGRTLMVEVRRPQKGQP